MAMKSCVALISTLAVFSLLASPSESALPELINALPSELVNSLTNASEFVTYTFTDTYPVTNLTVNMSAFGNMLVDNASIVSKVYSSSLVQMKFKVILPDVTLEGDLDTKGKYDGVWRHADFRAIALTNLTLEMESYFNTNTKALIVKNSISGLLEFYNDFMWQNCNPLLTECTDAEARTRKFMRESLIIEYNSRIHEYIFRSAPVIANKLAFWMNDKNSTVPIEN